jgi:hypothetical protein
LQGTRNGHVSCAFHHFTNALGLKIKITVDGSGQECPPETENALTAAEFRRIALSMPEATEGSHFGSADFRVGGKIFATLALEKEGYGVLLLTPEEQAGMVADEPTIFSPVPGGWGRKGSTRVSLAKVPPDILEAALRLAWRRKAPKSVRLPK